MSEASASYEYFEGDAPQHLGLPSVKYFADKVFLSPNYFGDMIRKQTGKTVSEYIQDKMIELAKEQLLSSGFKLPFVKAHTIIKQQSDIGTDEAATVSVDSMV